MLADLRNQFGSKDTGVVTVANNERFLDGPDNQISSVLYRLDLQMKQVCPDDEYKLFKQYQKMILNNLEV